MPGFHTTVLDSELDLESVLYRVISCSILAYQLIIKDLVNVLYTHFLSVFVGLGCWMTSAIILPQTPTSGCPRWSVRRCANGKRSFGTFDMPPAKTVRSHSTSLVDESWRKEKT